MNISIHIKSKRSIQISHFAYAKVRHFWRLSFDLWWWRLLYRECEAIAHVFIFQKFFFSRSFKFCSLQGCYPNGEWLMAWNKWRDTDLPSIHIKWLTLLYKNWQLIFALSVCMPGGVWRGTLFFHANLETHMLLINVFKYICLPINVFYFHFTITVIIAIHRDFIIHATQSSFLFYLNFSLRSFFLQCQNLHKRVYSGKMVVLYNVFLFQ